MTDKEIQKKLDLLTRVANELQAEAVRRYDHPEAGLFYADGAFNIMSGDSDEACHNRQEYVRFSSTGLCRMDSGAW